jgi:hypothetical protein
MEKGRAAKRMSSKRVAVLRHGALHFDVAVGCGVTVHHDAIVTCM